MPRPPRIDPPGAWHHVMNRGARHQAIFADDEDRELFLGLLCQLASRFGLEVHAYALMGNHFHLLLRSLRGRLSAGMRWLQHTWTQRVNRRHGWDGPLFRSRFRSQHVDDERYLHTVIAYIHNNPVKAGLAATAADARWTSCRAYAGLEKAPSWLHTAEVTALAGGPAVLAEQTAALADLPEDIAGELVLDLHVAGPLIGEPLGKPRDLSPPTDPVAALARIEAITGADLEALQRSAHGRGANPARRFAVWALRTSTDLSQSEVGELLKMSMRQVQNVDASLRSRWRPPIAGWAAAWLAGEG